MSSGEDEEQPWLLAVTDKPFISSGAARLPAHTAVVGKPPMVRSRSGLFQAHFVQLTSGFYCFIFSIKVGISSGTKVCCTQSLHLF